MFLRFDRCEEGNVSAPVTSPDWVHRRLPSLLVWKLRVAVLVGSAALGPSTLVRGLVWTLAFATVGLGGVRNALRCGRLHCDFAGPLFLALAGISLLHGTGAFDLGSNGWAWIGGVALAGGIGLTAPLERVWEKDASGRACSYLSLTLLVGLGANAVWGWWWSDPLAAVAMVPWLIREGREGFEDRCG